MKEFYFQIKGKTTDEHGYYHWSFPPIWSGKIDAIDKKEAKLLIKQEYDKKFPLRILAKDIDSNDFLLSIKEITEDNHYAKRLFEINECENPSCDQKFRLIEKYQMGNQGGGSSYCSTDCSREHNKIENYINNDNVLKPIIYKIANKITTMVYIGKTNQIFTLRWYQHFFQGTGTKFHQAIEKHDVTDWTFEVIEIVDIPNEYKANILSTKEIEDYILERENYYIQKYNSINNGYNSVHAKRPENKSQTKLQLDK